MVFLVLTAGISATVAHYVYRSTSKMVNDMMGALAIDIPVGTFLDAAAFQGYTVALGLFLPLAGVGLAISILHYHQLSEREFSNRAIYELKTPASTPR